MGVCKHENQGALVNVDVCMRENKVLSEGIFMHVCSCVCMHENEALARRVFICACVNTNACARRVFMCACMKTKHSCVGDSSTHAQKRSSRAEPK